MAGKQISSDQLSEAVKAYCEANNRQSSQSEEKPNKITIFDGTPQPGDPMLWLEDGLFRCSDSEFGLRFAEEYLRGPEKALAPVGGQKVAPRKYSRDGPINGSAIDAVRQCQATEKPVYSTGKDGKGNVRYAAAAKTNIAALMEAGGSLEIINRTHKPDFIEIAVRAVLGERHVDSSMSIYKQEYLAKKAWDWIVKVLMDEPGIVTGTDEWGMPEFREGATIKVRIADEGKSVLVALPAKIALWRELAREWQFAARVCESKAFSRAADMILRANFMTPEEEREEQAEINKIAEKEIAEAA